MDREVTMQLWEFWMLGGFLLVAFSVVVAYHVWVYRMGTRLFATVRKEIERLEKLERDPADWWKSDEQEQDDA